MQMTLKAGITALAGILVAMFAVNANAECGSFQKSHFGASLQQQSWEGKSLSSPASLLSVADSGEPIVGFWKVTFTSEGTPGIPDGTVIDQGVFAVAQRWNRNHEFFSSTSHAELLPGSVEKGGWVVLQAKSFCDQLRL